MVAHAPRHGMSACVWLLHPMLNLLWAGGLAMAAPPLAFTDTGTGDLYAEIERRASAELGDWHHVPVARLGNFLQQRWCASTVAASACERGVVGRDHHSGESWLELSTFTWEPDTPRVGGLLVSAGFWPAEGWGARLWISWGGGRVVGSGLQVELARFGGGEVQDLIPLGSELQWTVEETTFGWAAPMTSDMRGALTGLLQRLCGRPEDLQRLGEEAQAGLLAEVERGLTAGEARRCEYAPYRDDGIPPVCTPVPLDAGQVAAELERARTTIGRRRALLQSEAVPARAALLNAVPPALSGVSTGR